MKPTIHNEVDRDREFAAWMRELPGAESIAECIHCGICAGSCPLAVHMDRSPRQLMYLAREGWKNDVLSSFTIWLCTSCYQCTVKCPRGIHVTEVMYALKRRAIEEGRYPRRFAIPVLAREFGRMVRAKGRISEGRLVLGLKLRTNALGLLGMSGLGRRLFRAGRLSMRSESIRGRAQLSKLFEAVDREKGAAA